MTEYDLGGGRAHKRPRVDLDAFQTLVRSIAFRSTPIGAASSIAGTIIRVPLQLQEGGCTLQTEDINEGSTVQDVRRLRRVLGSRLLLNSKLRTEFVQQLERMLEEPEALRHLLLPLVPETQVMRR